MELTQALLTRRSHKVFTGEAVPDADLEALLDLAIWAPNHKFTEPWRFTVLPQRSVPQLWQAVQDAAHTEKARAKLPKLEEIVRGIGGAIAVRQVRTHDDLERDREDYAACAIAVQHIQLAAWDRGWASYWTTSPGFIGPELAPLWRCGVDETIIGVVFLGRAVLEMPAIRRHPAATLTEWV